MAFFRYKVVNPAGTFFEGVVEAATDVAASTVLEEQGYQVLFVRAARTPRAWRGTQGIHVKDLVILLRQLATLVGANLPLVEALDTLARQTESRQLQRIVREVREDVEGGQRFSDALARHPRVFSPFFIELIRTGEKVGKLDEVLEYLADRQEQEYDLRSRVSSMLIYPAFIFCSLIGVVIFMLVVVMPKMLDILKTTGVPLPWTTRFLITVSDWLLVWWWLVALVVIGGGIGFVALIRTATGRRWFDWILLRIPVARRMITAIAMVRVSNSLNMMLHGGVDLVGALRAVANITNNTLYAEMLERAARDVEDGNPLADSLTDRRLIPPLVPAMIRVGEQTGHLEKVLEKIGVFYNREVTNTTSALVSLIEPAIILILGVGVAVVVSAMILPMYQVAGGV